MPKFFILRRHKNRALKGADNIGAAQYQNHKQTTAFRPWCVELIKTISTFFYLGYLPLIPGTLASGAGVAIYLCLRNNVFLYYSVTAAVLLLGFLVGGTAEGVFRRKDPPCMVIDEVAGMLLSLSFLPYDIFSVALGFVLFRFFDILKPYPADKAQSLKGSAGIMGDDIIAALYTNIILQLVLRLRCLTVS